MQQTGDITWFVLMEDENIHTPEHPFCSNPTCPCREDPELIAEVSEAVDSGLLTPDEATRLVLGMML